MITTITYIAFVLIGYVFGLMTIAFFINAKPKRKDHVVISGELARQVYVHLDCVSCKKELRKAMGE